MEKNCKAYQGEREDHHPICIECPDAVEVEQLVNSMEWKRKINRMIEGYTDYERKPIKHVVCPGCAAHFVKKITSITQDPC